MTAPRRALKLCPDSGCLASAIATWRAARNEICEAATSICSTNCSARTTPESGHPKAVCRDVSVRLQRLCPGEFRQPRDLLRRTRKSANGLSRAAIAAVPLSSAAILASRIFAVFNQCDPLDGLSDNRQVHGRAPAPYERHRGRTRSQVRRALGARSPVPAASRVIAFAIPAASVLAGYQYLQMHWLLQSDLHHLRYPHRCGRSF
jgi:hypothetical protein